MVCGCIGVDFFWVTPISDDGGTTIDETERESIHRIITYDVEAKCLQYPISRAIRQAQAYYSRCSWDGIVDTAKSLIIHPVIVCDG